MTAQNSDSGWFTRERLLTITLALATLISLYLCYRIIEPFIPSIAFAVALVVATYEPYCRLRAQLHNDTFASVVAILFVILLILGPAILIGTYLIEEAANYVDDLRSTGVHWRTIIESHPKLQMIVTWVEQRFDIEAQIGQIAQTVTGRAAGFLTGSIVVIAQLVITLFVLFFLYRDHRIALRSLRKQLPLSEDETNRLFSRVADTINAIVRGALTVALVQAILGGTMYLLLGVPGAALWTILTFIAALVPVFGTVLIWGPIAAYLLFTATWVKAFVLIGWGIFAVGTIDNLLYPFLVGNRVRLHTVPTFFSIVGGVQLFGASGLIIGPLVLAITVALLNIWRDRTTQGRAAEEEVAQQPRPIITDPAA
jgi:predicted PurR-regulated permease PerM